MAKKKKKFYVVWQGHKPGIYKTWDECKAQVNGFSNADYKSFKTLEEAENAYNGKEESTDDTQLDKSIEDSYCVDAACSGNPGPLEYRGVYNKTKEEIFKLGPFENGTNNIGEFLAIVHALAIFKKREISKPIYSDSLVAIGWVKKKNCKTTIEKTTSNEKLFDLIERAETWLDENTYSNKILKWDTKSWGEIPADFGRK